MRQKYFHLTIISLIFFVATGKQAIGQRDTAKMNQNVEVVKPYRPSISNAQKINQMPVIQDTAHFTPEFNYSIENYPFNSGFRVNPTGPEEPKVQQEKYNGIGYLKAGAGFYNTIYGDLFINVPKSKHLTFGLNLHHLSSMSDLKLSKGDLVDAPYSHDKALIFGSYLIGGSTLSADLSYNRDMVRFYGYPDTIPRNYFFQDYAPYFGSNQIFQKAKFNIGLKSNEGSQSKLEYNTGLRFYYFNAETGQKENSGGLFANFDYQFDKFRGILESSFDTYTTKGILVSPDQDKQDNWLKLTPAAKFSDENWSFKGGVSFYSVSSQNGTNMARLYPDIDLTYSPVKDALTLFANIGGYLQNCDYSTIAYENYWVDPMHDVKNADHRYVISGGLKGKITKQISFLAKIKYSDIKDFHYYITKSPDIVPPFYYNNAFDILYDNTGIFNISAELSYVKGKDYSIKIKGNYYSYTTENLGFAPLQPDFDLSATADFRINNKLNGFADLIVTGRRNGLIQYADNTITKYPLDPIGRINLGADYELTHNLKIFGRIDNLLDQHYEQLPGYTTQGLRLLAGISLSF